jgi:hypothetical protein
MGLIRREHTQGQQALPSWTAQHREIPDAKPRICLQDAWQHEVPTDESAGGSFVLTKTTHWRRS